MAKHLQNIHKITLADFPCIVFKLSDKDLKKVTNTLQLILSLTLLQKRVKTAAVQTK